MYSVLNLSNDDPKIKEVGKPLENFNIIKVVLKNKNNIQSLIVHFGLRGKI